MKISVIEELVYTYLNDHSGQTFKSKELARKLDIPKHEQMEFRKLLRAMVKDGRIFRYKKGQYGLGGKVTEVVGKLHVNSSDLDLFPRKAPKIFLSVKKIWARPCTWIPCG